MIEFYTYNLQLKNTFKISYGSRDFQPTLIVAISKDGFTGYGEAAATSYYGISTKKMIDALKNVTDLVEENIDQSPEKIWDITHPYLKDHPFAQCALDIALHDLNGKIKGRKLYEMWNLNLQNLPITSYTIGMDSIENIVAKIKEFKWPIYKIKLGSQDDVKIIRELRKHTNSIFRVDANSAWNVDEAISNSKKMKELNVEFLEQPLHPEDIDGMRVLYKKSDLPLIADESFRNESDIEHCSNYFHGINIKLTKCGGITPALRIIKKAKKLNLKLMMGCMTESTVGISAIAHFLPLLNYVDMDGALLLKSDIATGVEIYDGKVHFPDRNGTGAELFNKSI